MLHAQHRRFTFAAHSRLCRRRRTCSTEFNPRVFVFELSFATERLDDLATRCSSVRSGPAAGAVLAAGWAPGPSVCGAGERFQLTDQSIPNHHFQGRWHSPPWYNLGVKVRLCRRGCGSGRARRHPLCPSAQAFQSWPIRPVHVAPHQASGIVRSSALEDRDFGAPAGDPQAPSPEIGRPCSNDARGHRDARACAGCYTQRPAQYNPSRNQNRCRSFALTDDDPDRRGDFRRPLLQPYKGNIEQ